MNVVLRVLRIDLLQLARDKRALFSAIVLPALLYPALFWGMGQLESVGEKTMAERDLSVLIDLDAGGLPIRRSTRCRGWPSRNSIVM